MYPLAVVLGQLACTVAALGFGVVQYRRARAFEVALVAQRKLTGRTRQPALTRVMPMYHAPLADPVIADLPRFSLTALDGRRDPDGVVRPPPLPADDTPANGSEIAASLVRSMR